MSENATSSSTTTGLATTGLIMRLATRDDVFAIRALLGDDKLGQSREDMSDKGLEKYLAAFDAINNSPDNQLWVAQDASISDTGETGAIVGTWQVTYIPYLSRGGNLRCLIEAVRTASNRRGEGIGRKMMEFALDQARQRDCLLVQLTTDKTRLDAHRFYKNLGFVASHEGMKIQL